MKLDRNKAKAEIFAHDVETLSQMLRYTDEQIRDHSG